MAKKDETYKLGILYSGVPVLNILTEANMPASLAFRIYEIINIIQPQIEERLYAYLICKAAELGVYVYIVGGWYDHVHVIVSIPPKLAVAEVVKRLKGASSHYLNHEMGLDLPFAWQRGYGALSFGERQRPIAEAYVANQKQHHRDKTTNAWLERYTIPSGRVAHRLEAHPAGICDSA